MNTTGIKTTLEKDRTEELKKLAEAHAKIIEILEPFKSQEKLRLLRSAGIFFDLELTFSLHKSIVTSAER